MKANTKHFVGFTIALLPCTLVLSMFRLLASSGMAWLLQGAVTHSERVQLKTGYFQ